MTFDPSRLAGLSDDVARAYTEAEVHLLTVIADSVARKGGGGPDWANNKLTEVRRVRALASEQVQLLALTGPHLAETAIMRGWNIGDGGAAKDIADMGGSFRATGTTNYRAVNALVAETSRDLTLVHRNILRAVEDDYRQVVREVAAREIAGAATSRQVQQTALDRLAAKGITGFTDARGRQWSMGAYVEMAVRTATHRAALEGHNDHARRHGFNLIRVSSHRNPAPQCAPFERQVLSLTDGVSGEVEVRGGSTVHVKASLSDAERRGLHHPNCKHTHTIYVPGMAIPEPAPFDEAGYKGTQRQRAIERRIREWKRREAVAVDPPAKAYAAKYRKAAQADMRSHLDRTGLTRRSFREKTLTPDGEAGRIERNRVARRLRAAKKATPPKPPVVPPPPPPPLPPVTPPPVKPPVKPPTIKPTVKKPPLKPTPKKVTPPPVTAGLPNATIVERVRAARAARPDTPDGWNAKLGRTRVSPDMDELDAKYDKKLANAKGRVESGAAEVEFAEARYASVVEKQGQEAADGYAAASLKYARQYHEAAKATLADMPSRADFRITEAARLTRLEYDYGKDPTGKLMPSKALNATLDEHMDLGRAITADLERVLDADQKLRDIRLNGGAGKLSRKVAVRVREHELVTEYMRGLREYDGPTIPAVKMKTGHHKSAKIGPFKDHEKVLREAEQSLPAEWRQRAGDQHGALALGTSKSGRAFHLSGQYGRPSLIASGDDHYYDGGMRNSLVETMLHELGHHMEHTIEALPQLEFALVYRRATLPNGKLEPESTIYAGKSEKSRKDHWPASYTGKDYSRMFGTDKDPAATPAWELFQTGVQSFVGRNKRYTDPDLDAFTAAALAVL